eukprot:TRINITY_DN19413_c0_g1_i1.p1 TRINITY_DN19413_c0_g1~~TRINITY_DN19413_c0_g1_i1.p1  ORF type:complete len:151 (-),score=2.05 TRINITY_DN19413_c0_g1_i1:256-708(-)
MLPQTLPRIRSVNRAVSRLLGSPTGSFIFCLRSIWGQDFDQPYKRRRRQELNVVPSVGAGDDTSKCIVTELLLGVSETCVKLQLSETYGLPPHRTTWETHDATTDHDREAANTNCGAISIPEYAVVGSFVVDQWESKPEHIRAKQKDSGA